MQRNALRWEYRGEEKKEKLAYANTSHRDALAVVGGRELRLGRLDRIQRGRKLIGPELLPVRHLTVPLRILGRRSTRCPQTLRQ